MTPAMADQFCDGCCGPYSDMPWLMEAYGGHWDTCPNRRNYRHLAVGFVEATTQYDYTDVPDHVQSQLNRAADALGRWMETQGVYRIEPNQDVPCIIE